MRYFKNPDELLSLFGIDPDRPGPREFSMLCDLMGVMLLYPQYNVTVSALAQTRQRQLKWSPRVYWCTIKRGIRPIMEAEPETLRALGVRYSADARARTCPELALAVAEALVDGWEDGAELAETAATIAKACGRAK